MQTHKIQLHLKKKKQTKLSILTTEKLQSLSQLSVYHDFMNSNSFEEITKTVNNYTFLPWETFKINPNLTVVDIRKDWKDFFWSLILKP